ncbi:MAG: enoyl-CoA hydratase/isomerase family protein [Desulfobacteraceae bacterium]|nr:MAG: enoyl-CoA hydratase/isomerase family protein [Desulfobacteraceae bacterium]
MKHENLLTAQSGHIMTVTLNRKEKLNAMNTKLLFELQDLLRSLRGDQSVRFVIFTGAGRAFSSGVEFSEAEMEKRYAEPGLGNERLWQLFGQEFMHLMENLEQITLAAVNGPAVGAGLCLAMCCDFRIASEKALFGIPEANLGIFFTWGATPRLTALIGPSRAKEMIMTCDNFSAQEALSIGLVNRVVPHDSLMGYSEDFLEKIGRKGPLAIRICKKIVNAASLSRMADLYICEPELVERLMLSGDAKEGIEAFLEKRTPRFPSQGGKG